MQTKLTLRLDEDLIRKAKEYARNHHKSLSQMVSEYFTHIESVGLKEDQDLPPLTKSLVGVMRGSRLDEEEYWSHLEEKHL